MADLALFLLGLGLKDLRALVRAAIGAGMMRKPHAAALGALHDVHRRQGVMGAAAITAALGQLTFWMRWHW